MAAHVSSNRRPRLVRVGVALAAVLLVAACSQGSNESTPSSDMETSTTGAATTTVAVDQTFERLSKMVLTYYKKTISQKVYVAKIIDQERADCIAAGSLQIQGFRSILEELPDSADFDQLATGLYEKLGQDEGRSMQFERDKVFWRCISIADIVQLTFGETGDCCRDVYPEGTLGCLRTEFAKMDREMIYDELLHSALSEPLGAEYEAAVTGCGVSLPEPPPGG